MERTRGFGGLNTGGGRDKGKRPEEIVEVLTLGKDFTQVRFVGEVVGYAQHWIEIVTAKGVISIPKVVPNYDPKTDTYDQTIKDPYDKIENPKRTGKVYFVNAIVRDLQDDYKHKKAKEKFSKKELKSGVLDAGSKSKTPVRVVRIPTGVAQDLQRIMTMNKHKVDGKVQECELSDPKYGCDVWLSFDASINGPKKYTIQKGDHSPLTKEEQEYLLWDITELMLPEPPEEAKKEAAALASKCPQDEDMRDDDKDDADALDRKRKKDKGGKSKAKDKDKKSEKPAAKDKKADKPDKSDKKPAKDDGGKKAKDKGADKGGKSKDKPDAKKKKRSI